MSFLLSKPEPSPEVEPFDLPVRKTPTQHAGRRVPLWWGLSERSGIWMTHLFGVRRTAITQNIQTGKKSNKEEVTGHNNYASYAMLMGFGPVNKVTRASSGGKELWSGSVSKVDDLPAVISITDLGEIVYYWGTATQGGRTVGSTSDSLLATIGSQPAYRDLSYFVADDHFFGQQTSPRPIELRMVRIPKRLILDPANQSGDPENDADSFHHVNDEALLAEVAYDILTNVAYGAGEDAAEIIDTQSFIDAANDYRTDGFGLSPFVGESDNVRKFLADLLGHHHATINEVNGKFKFRILKSTDAVVNIPFAAMLDEPKPNPGTWEDTWNKTVVNFSSQVRDLEPLPAVHFDDANIEVMDGIIRPKTFQRKFATVEAIANQIACWMGSRGGLPSVPVKLKLNHTHSGLLPGDRLSFDYAKRAITNFGIVVKKIVIGGPRDAAIDVEAEIDRLPLLDPAAVADDFLPSLTPVDPDDSFFRVAALTGFQLGDSLDGLLIAAARQDQQTTRGFVRASSDDTTYQNLDEIANFALRVQVLRWEDVGAGNIIADVNFVTLTDNQEWLDIINEQVFPEVYMVTGKREVIAAPGVDRLRLEPVWSVLRFESPIENLESQNTGNFTVDIGDDLIVSAGHPFSNGDIFKMRNTGGALPGGLPADTWVGVAEVTATTWEAYDLQTGQTYTISDAGTGTHEWFVDKHWRLRFESGQFGSEKYRVESGALHGIFPTDIGFIGPKKSFAIIKTDQFKFFQPVANDGSDTALKRYLRIQTRIDGQIQPLANAFKVVYDRDGVPATFTVDTATDELISTGHTLQDGDRIGTRVTGGSLAAGLTLNEVRYVRDKSTDRFKTSKTLDGAVEDLTTAGSGTQQWYLADGSYDLDWGPKAANSLDFGDPVTNPEDDPNDPINSEFASLVLDDNNGPSPHTVEFTLSVAFAGIFLKGMSVVYGDGNSEGFAGPVPEKVWTHQYTGAGTYNGYVTGKIVEFEPRFIDTLEVFNLPFTVTVT